MIAAEVAISSRRAQGLADRVTDDQTLDAIASLMAASPVPAPTTGSGRRGNGG